MEVVVYLPCSQAPCYAAVEAVPEHWTINAGAARGLFAPVADAAPHRLVDRARRLLQVPLLPRHAAAARQAVGAGAQLVVQNLNA